MSFAPSGFFVFAPHCCHSTISWRGVTVFRPRRALITRRGSSARLRPTGNYCVRVSLKLRTVRKCVKRFLSLHRTSKSLCRSGLGNRKAGVEKESSLRSPATLSAWRDDQRRSACAPAEIETARGQAVAPEQVSRLISGLDQRT